MNIPKFWAKGQTSKGFASWQSSNISIDDARLKAEARAAELARKFQSGQRLNWYDYGDRPLREEIVQTLKKADDATLAVVTRNLYGSLVLNTAGAMFIDVDFESIARPAQQRKDFFDRFSSTPQPAELQYRALDQVQAWARNVPELCVRVYRTFAGLRCLIVNRPFDPASPETISLLQGAGSDPLYIKLCKAQNCFRARLTPKPWRCGTRRPPVQYPRASKDESSFRQWQSKYDNASMGFCVCRFLRQIGSASAHVDIQPIIALHDQMTCTEVEHPLA